MPAPGWCPAQCTGFAPKKSKVQERLLAPWGSGALSGSLPGPSLPPSLSVPSHPRLPVSQEIKHVKANTGNLAGTLQGLPRANAPFLSLAGPLQARALLQPCPGPASGHQQLQPLAFTEFGQVAASCTLSHVINVCSICCCSPE